MLTDIDLALLLSNACKPLKCTFKDCSSCKDKDNCDYDNTISLDDRIKRYRKRAESKIYTDL